MNFSVPVSSREKKFLKNFIRIIPFRNREINFDEIYNKTKLKYFKPSEFQDPEGFLFITAINYASRFQSCDKINTFAEQYSRHGYSFIRQFFTRQFLD